METVPAQTTKNPVNMRLWIIAALVIIGVVLVLLNLNKQKDEKADASSPDTKTVESTETANDETKVKATPVLAVDADQSLLYTTALAKYAGRRVEFSTNCQMSPARSAFTNGTKVMLDNRGSVANTVIVGDNLYRIQAYNFSFITLSAESLPTTFKVSCGTNTNAGTISVAK